MGDKTRFGQWLEDFRWAMNVMRARRWRRELAFSRRVAFDDALRRPLRGAVIAYPDAFYYVTIDDLCRAMEESAKPRLRV